MSVSIIQLICITILSVCLISVSFWCISLRKYINELKGDIADEKFEKQTLINQQEKKIKTLHIIYNKPFDYARVGIKTSFSFNDVKQRMAEYIAQQIIKDNILQIKNFDSYYEGSVDFVKSEKNFQESIDEF